MTLKGGSDEATERRGRRRGSHRWGTDEYGWNARAGCVCYTSAGVDDVGHSRSPSGRGNGPSLYTGQLREGRTGEGARAGRVWGFRGKSGGVFLDFWRVRSAKSVESLLVVSGQGDGPPCGPYRAKVPFEESRSIEWTTLNHRGRLHGFGLTFMYEVGDRRSPAVRGNGGAGVLSAPEP